MSPFREKVKYVGIRKFFKLWNVQLIEAFLRFGEMIELCPAFRYTSLRVSLKFPMLPVKMSEMRNFYQASRKNKAE